MINIKYRRDFRLWNARLCHTYSWIQSV